MKKLIKPSIIILLILLILQACTIEKRAFMPGYHIDWKYSTPISNNHSIKEKTDNTFTKIEKDSIVNQELILVSENNNDAKNSSEQTINISQRLDQTNSKENLRAFNSKNIEHKELKINQTNSKEIKKELKAKKTIVQKEKSYDDHYGSDLNIFALISIIAALLSIIFAGIALISLTVAILGLIFGILGNNEISRGDYLYGLNKMFAVIGIVISSIMILVNIIFLLGILFLFLIFIG